MFKTQTALLAYIGKFKDTVTNLDLKPKTIEPYAGQIPDILKSPRLIPAMMPVLQPSRPISKAGVYAFDVIIIVRSRTLSTENNIINNLELTSLFCDFVEANPAFTDTEFDYDIINRSDIVVRPVAIEKSASGFAVSLEIRKNRPYVEEFNNDPIHLQI